MLKRVQLMSGINYMICSVEELMIVVETNFT